METTPVVWTSARTLRQRAAFVARPVLVVSAALMIFAPFLAGFAFITALTLPGCAAPASTSDPAAWGMAAESVSFPSAALGQPVPAYFIPAEQPNGATVIVVPTGHERRGDRMPEIAVYHRHGYQVLSYEGRGCVAAVSNSLGYREVPLVGDALAYLAARGDVDANRIAVHGFSAGGATAIMAAAQYVPLRAVVALGGYHNFGAHVDANSDYLGILGGLFRFGARAGYRLTTGDDLDVLNPIGAIPQIAPRPVLLVYGTNEPSLYGARLMQAAGGANVTLWEVPGATHGSYVFTASDDYERVVIGFMDGALGIRDD